jgi:2,4-dienoyl-CoA reductase-like NADH-dependent reductase (Old Yellow Enzyme family)
MNRSTLRIELGDHRLEIEMSRLFSEFKIGGVTLANRVVVPPMCQYMAVDGLPGPWHHMHYGAMAISGAALTIVEATGVEAISRISPNCLGLYNDEQEAGFREMLARIRTFCPTKWGVQLAHAGRKASGEPFDARGAVLPENGGWETIAPSAIAAQDGWPATAEMSLDDIARVIESFAAAARRADRAGFDVIEVHAAHGYLISSFLSPLINRRTDNYGGSLENRMRFAVEIARALRAACPAEKAIGFRVNGTDWHDGGIVIEETIALAKALRQEGMDFVTVSSGGNTRKQKLPRLTPGYQVALARAVRDASGIATMAVGMVLTADQAEEIIDSDAADLVAVARATLDDPRWALHAAQELGGEIAYPRPMWRLTAKYWPGYKFVHPLRQPVQELDWR